MTQENDPQLERLLEFLRRERGFDFTGYKRPSLMRRIARRMQSVGVEGYDAYADYLALHPEEFGQLFNSILINVTSFFRDEYAWAYLRSEILPALVKGSGPVRVWSAGCASGQEAYSIAMALAEEMGPAEFRERVKVYATDVDEEALAQARLGSYSAKEMEDLDPALRERYFEPQNSRHVFRTDLRRSIIFGRHDLVQDAPISRLNLLLCRNALMYFNAETQAKVLERFHFALNGEHGGGGGILFLGRAEMLLTHANLFTPIDLKSRIFAKVPQPEVRLRIPVTPPGAEDGPNPVKQTRLRELAIEEAPVARIVVDANGFLALANQRARLLFSLSPKDVGRPLQDLEISYRPAELRSLIEQAYAERRVVTQTSVERRFNENQVQYLDIVVQPLYDEGQKPLGVGITFMDMTRYYQLQQELQHSREEIQTANEELQSSNEELETTNEELQSTNEELETMNEELQSTNEELQTVNEELRTRTEEMNQLNAFLESVLTGMRSGAVVIDHNFNVLVWNRRAEDLWGLRADEVRAKSLLGLDIGLPVAELRPMIRACLSGESEYKEMTLQAVNRRGKQTRCRVTCTALVSPSRKREGVILLMDELE